MLVLSRKLNEAIVAVLEDGRRIHFTIVRIDAQKVRVGCDGDETIKFLRDELDVADERTAPPPPPAREAVA